MKVEKNKQTSRGSCLPSGHSYSSVGDMTSWAEFNQEGHHVCLAHKTLAFNPALLNPNLFFPFQICMEAVPSVRFSYSISCQGLESDQSGVVKRLRSTPPTPNRTKKQRSNPPPTGVVMGPADYPCGSQPFGPTGGSNSGG